MADPIRVYSLGKSGVMLDPNPLSADLPDDALVNAQNATHEPTAGHLGGLRKRPGLARFNAVYAGGSILGGIMAPVAGTGSAPAAAAGSGPTGDSTGSGAGTGAPGGTPTGSAVTYGSAGASAFGGGSLFGGARLLVIGFADNTVPNQYGEGFYVTSKKMNNTANLVSTPGPAAESGLSGIGEEFFKGSPSVVMPDGFLYYAKAHVVGTSEVVHLRKTNGLTDVEVAQIPVNAYGFAAKNVNWMHHAVYPQSQLGLIYICISDKFTGGNLGRIFVFSPVSNGLVEMNLSTTPAGVGVTPLQYADNPSCCARFSDAALYPTSFFWGTAPNVQDSGATINVLSTESSGSPGNPQYGIVDYNPGSDQRFANITCMLGTSSGVLLAGTGCRTAGVVQRSQVLVRQPGVAIGAAGAWNANNIDVVGGDTLIDKNYYVSMVEFNGGIYVSWYNPTQQARIYKIGLGVSGGITTITSASVSYASSGATGRVPFYLFVDDGVLYGIGSTGIGGAQRLIYTTDGVTWTDQTTNFATTNSASASAIAFGLNQ